VNVSRGWKLKLISRIPNLFDYLKRAIELSSELDILVQAESMVPEWLKFQVHHVSN
jgi:hypothetical protein